jgi:hypothetical protein
MSDETDEIESHGLPELVEVDGEVAMATYSSHTAELAQAFGNLLIQAMRMPPNHHFVPVALTMLEKIAANVEVNQKGSLRAVKGGKD